MEFRTTQLKIIYVLTGIGILGLLTAGCNYLLLDNPHAAGPFFVFGFSITGISLLHYRAMKENNSLHDMFSFNPVRDRPFLYGAIAFSTFSYSMQSLNSTPWISLAMIFGSVILVLRAVHLAKITDNLMGIDGA